MKGILTDCSDRADNFSLERRLHQKGYCCVAGCDEAGRGPLAGPVVAACVVLPLECEHALFLDSKILPQQKRLDLNNHLLAIGASIGIGIVSEQQIDLINILQASLSAMRLAVENMTGTQPDFILVDGKFEVPLTIPQAALIKGESKSASIAAASIIAKVARDRIMEALHEQYPIYNFSRHKGYPTSEHREALCLHGPCPVHRMTFKGVREHVGLSAAPWP
ncbi:MAG: ribonuclease HII [Desulfobulbaceae bacterium BRH_c16a]|nr:MAG: ribonuclease HII [Desulfobulbaceae bacterium BRH_c16a]